MKSKRDTLLDIIRYVENESNDAISELLNMGFSPSQLVWEFGYDEDRVKTSPLYAELVSPGEEEDLEEDDYPFVLGLFNRFDAALVSRYQISKEDLRALKGTNVYKKMQDMYFEEYEEALTDVLNIVFDRFDDKVTSVVEFGK